MSQKKVCILGCGSIAGGVDDVKTDHVLSHAKAISLHDQFDLFGCYDLDSKLASDFQSRWDVVNCYTDLGSALNSEVDVFVIATPNHTHFDLIKEVLKTDCKYLICEKPLVTSYEQLDELVELFRTTDKKIVVNFSRRFDSAHREIKRVIESGELGELLHFHAHIGKGLIHNGSHFIDTLLWYFGDISNIECITAKRVDDDFLGSFEIEMRSGARGIVQNTAEVHYSLYDLNFVFTGGRIDLPGVEFDCDCYKPLPSKIYNGFNNLSVEKRFAYTLNRAMYNLYSSLLEEDLSSLLAQAIEGTRVLLELKEKH